MEVLIGVIAGAAIPLLKDWISARRAEKLERIKLHDTQRIKAYQVAYKFSSTLRMSLKDKSQAKDLAFLNNCASGLYAVIESLPYYSKKVRSSLIELESVMEYVMSNIMEIDTNSDLIDEKVKPVSVKLNNDILCDFKVWE
jgi:hypothetical protein